MNLTSAVRLCKHCDKPLPAKAHRCINPKCRQWNDVGEVQASKALTLDEATVLLSDASYGEVERTMTGLVDTVFGGGKGIARTSANLLGGEPGAGKTTLCLMLSDIYACTYPDKEVLYIANEQDPAELRDTAKRLKMKRPNRIRMVKAMGGVNFDLGDLLLRYEPSLIILDSVTKWVGEDVRMAVRVAERLKDYTVRLKAPSVIVNQVTKGGDHSGLNALQHAVDGCFLFDILLDPDERATPDTPRRLMSTKNRFAPAPLEQWYRLENRGLVEIPLCPLGLDDDESGCSDAACPVHRATED